MSTQARKQCGHSYRWVTSNLNELSAFPRRHEDPWGRQELPRELIGVFAEARDRGLINKVGTKAYDADPRHEYNLYRLTASLDAMIERYSDPDRDTLPCGHTGITNIPGGDYGCSAPHCHQEYPRHVAEEVLNQ